MQFVEIGVRHEIVQTFMHVNVGITSSYMWGLHGCAPFIHTNILAHQLFSFKNIIISCIHNYNCNIILWALFLDSNDQFLGG